MARKKATTKKVTKKKVSKKKPSTTKATSKKTNTKKKVTETKLEKKRTMKENVQLVANFVDTKAQEFETICKEAAALVGLDIEISVFLDVKGFSQKKANNVQPN